MHSDQSGAKRTGGKAPRFYFDLHRICSYLGSLLLGVVFSALSFTAWGERLSLQSPESMLTVVLIQTAARPPFFSLFPELVLSAVLRSFPLMMLFWLGLRARHYFPFSGFWNMIFAATQGVWLHRFFGIVSDATAANRLQGFTAVAAILSLIVLLILQFLCLERFLVINRIAVRGVPVPCLMRGVFRDPFGVVEDGRPAYARIRRYFSAVLTESLVVVLIQLSLSVIGYLFRVLTGW